MEPQKNTSFGLGKFSLREMVVFIGALCAVLGWFSAHQQLRLMRQEADARQLLMEPAAIESSSVVDFDDIVGSEISQHALICALGNPQPAQANRIVEFWLKYRDTEKLQWPDRFGNRPESWNQIELDRPVDRYKFPLSRGIAEGEISHTIFLIVQDDIVMLVIEAKSSLEF